MNSLMPMFIGAFVGVVVGSVVLLITVLSLPKRCGKCQAPFPLWRWEWKRRGWKRKRRDGKHIFVCG
jgi:hypothetical protein